jgi:protein SCO1/2
MIKRYTLLGIAVLAGLAFTLAAWQVIPWPYTYRGVQIDPPAPAADFTLTDQKNQPFQLSNQRGKVALLFFGYAHCPDVCPVTLSIFSQVRKSLGPQADEVSFVFVTVDPERDTPEALGKYLANFSAPLTGLTGSRAELEPVWKSYGVYQARQGEGGGSFRPGLRPRSQRQLAPDVPIWGRSRGYRRGCGTPFEGKVRPE